MPPDAPARTVSLDQVRGYAIFGMVLVNVLGQFSTMPWMLKHHHTGYSYADSIAPLFVFVVGMGFRMSLRGRIARDGSRAAYTHSAQRYAILILLGMLYGGFNLRTGVWDALTDIGFSGLLALPFLLRSWPVRAAASAAYLGVYELLFRFTGYGEWAMGNTINGGPLGPLSWVFLLLWGTVAWDILALGRPVRGVLACLVAGATLLAAGWLLHMPWGAWKPLWPFSQYWMTAPYPVFSAGICFCTVAAFVLLCDVLKARLPMLTPLGRNPLFLYLLQALLVLLVSAAVPGGVSTALALAAWAAVYGTVYAAALALHRRGIVIRL